MQAEIPAFSARHTLIGPLHGHLQPLQIFHHSVALAASFGFSMQQFINLPPPPSSVNCRASEVLHWYPVPYLYKVSYV